MIFDFDSHFVVFRTADETLAIRLASIVQVGPVIEANGLFNVPCPKSLSTEIELIDLPAGV